MLAVGGCARNEGEVDPADRVFFVPGVAGDGPWYGPLREGLREGGVAAKIETVKWGMPPPMTMLNFQAGWVHREAERKLAGKIARWRSEHSEGHLSLVAHSAGCGVVLGALSQLPGDVHVDDVLLLSPSVSPQYDLSPPVEHVRGRLHVFHSENDAMFLGWRARTFGTYDNVKTEAAGRRGFSGLERLPAEVGRRVVQHAYQPQWRALGNDGGHFGATAHRFAANVLAKLLSDQDG